MDQEEGGGGRGCNYSPAISGGERMLTSSVDTHLWSGSFSGSSFCSQNTGLYGSQGRLDVADKDETTDVGSTSGFKCVTNYMELRS
jgi:hypothetical protein